MHNIDKPTFLQCKKDMLRAQQRRILKVPPKNVLVGFDSDIKGYLSSNACLGAAEKVCALILSVHIEKRERKRTYSSALQVLQNKLEELKPTDLAAMPRIGSKVFIASVPSRALRALS